ncbi:MULTISPECIES: FkbM family methyltransferase [unclassified Bradyrhizobium]|uniref:FkbM family methyltransferase n=1 Tax=unclassified Bradyrhizobium TaxID=2631580 RepID=UPI002FF2F2C7
MTTPTRVRPKNEILVYRAIDNLLRYCLRKLPPTKRIEAIALWWGYRFQPAPRLSRLRSGSLIETTHADHLQLLIYYLGTFEPYCMPFVRGCVSPGGTIVDVGANIGVYTLEGAAAVGATGRVISIEAAPLHAKALSHNIELNGLTNVSVIETAVGRSRGEATLARLSKDNLGMFSLGANGDVEATVVTVRTIDELLEEYGVRSIDLIKMDIEGSEYNALLGAERIIRTARPAILIELNEPALRSCGSSSRDVRRLLHGMDYRGWKIGRSCVKPLTNENDMIECDECIFIPRDNQTLIAKLGLEEPIVIN